MNGKASDSDVDHRSLLSVGGGISAVFSRRAGTGPDASAGAEQRRGYTLPHRTRRGTSNPPMPPVRCVDDVRVSSAGNGSYCGGLRIVGGGGFRVNGRRIN